VLFHKVDISSFKRGIDSDVAKRIRKFKEFLDEIKMTDLPEKVKERLIAEKKKMLKLYVSSAKELLKIKRERENV